MYADPIFWSLRTVPPSTKTIFSEHWLFREVDLSCGYWNMRRKQGLTMHFSEIIKFMPKRTIGILFTKTKKHFYNNYYYFPPWSPIPYWWFSCRHHSQCWFLLQFFQYCLLFFFTFRIIFALNFPRNSTICEICQEQSQNT